MRSAADRGLPPALAPIHITQSAPPSADELEKASTQGDVTAAGSLVPFAELCAKAQHRWQQGAPPQQTPPMQWQMLSAPMPDLLAAAQQHPSPLTHPPTQGPHGGLSLLEQLADELAGLSQDSATEAQAEVGCSDFMLQDNSTSQRGGGWNDARGNAMLIKSAMSHCSFAIPSSCLMLQLCAVLVTPYLFCAHTSLCSCPPC